MGREFPSAAREFSDLQCQIYTFSMQPAPPLQKDRLDSCSLFHTVSLWVQEKTEGLSPPLKGIARGGGKDL